MYNNGNVFDKINKFEEKNSELMMIVEVFKTALADKGLCIEGKKSWNLPGYENCSLYECFDGALVESLKNVDSKLLMQRKRLTELIRNETGIEIVFYDSTPNRLKEGFFTICIREHDCASVVMSMDELENL